MTIEPRPQDADGSRQGRLAPTVTTLRSAPTAISADLLAGPARSVQALLLALAACFLAAIAWASFAVVEEVTVGQGKVIPARKIQLVQNLEGGIVDAILTAEGAIVEEGAPLVLMNSTGHGSDLDEKHEKIAGLTIQRERLLAEADGRPFQLAAELAARRPEQVRQQREHLESRGREIRAALDAIERQGRQKRQEMAETEARIASLVVSLRLANEELQLTEPLIRQGAAAKVDVLRLQGRISELTGQLESARLALPRLAEASAEAESQRSQKQMSFRSETFKELADVEVQLASLTQSVRGQADKVARTQVRAPARGIVKTLNVTTVGQVLRPGQDIAEIVPLDDTLLVEARVQPKDVAFLRPGQDAVVKITAYDYAVYGSLKGRLERIGADAVTTEKGDSYYVIGVRTDRSALEKAGKVLPIIPGMIAEVDILSGGKTVMQYILKPIVRLQHESLRER